MSLSRTRGDHAQGAVPPLLLVLVGLLVTVVACLGLVLQPRGSMDSTAATRVTAPLMTSEARMPDVLPASVDALAAEPTSARAPSSRPASAEGVDNADKADKVSSLATTTGPASSPTQAPAASATEEFAASPAEAPAPSATEAVVSPSSPAQAAGAPSWIRIDSGGVDGPLTPRGLAPDGKINPGRQEILWFTGHGRVSPGDVGTAVIAGHVSWEGQPDVFVNLSSVSVGDLVTVGYTDGTSRSFSVVSTAAVDKDDLSRSVTVWGAHPDRPRLAIITCDPALGYQPDGHTAGNFVVIAEG